VTQTLGSAGEAPGLHTLRQARTRALARRGRGVAALTATRAYLVCVCGPDRFGLPLGHVAQVLPTRPVTPLPGAPPAVLGLIALSGRVVSLLALGRALGRPAEPSDEAGHVVVVRGATVPVALAVDRVLGVAEIADEALDSAYAETGLSAEAVSGYAPAGAGQGAETGFVVLDLPRLMRRYLS
jgi:purine-binding chemotaxis protein CheW